MCECYLCKGKMMGRDKVEIIDHEGVDFFGIPVGGYICWWCIMNFNRGEGHPPPYREYRC